MGVLFDKYKKLKERTATARGIGVDVSRIAFDISKNNPYAREQRRRMKDIEF